MIAIPVPLQHEDKHIHFAAQAIAGLKVIAVIALVICATGAFSFAAIWLSVNVFR